MRVLLDSAMETLEDEQMLLSPVGGVCVHLACLASLSTNRYFRNGDGETFVRSASNGSLDCPCELKSILSILVAH